MATRKYRRWEAPPLLVGALIAVGFPVAVLVNWPQPVKPPLLAGCAVAVLLVMCYIDGPAVWVSVGPEQVTVANWLVIHRVPRGLVDRVEEVDRLGMDLVLTDGTKIGLGAWQPSLVPATSRSRGRSAYRSRQLLALFADLPAAPTGGVVRRRPRLVNIALLAAPIVGFWIVLGL
ncbi:hypothetical protein GCM10009827_119160 [Dactylosporangium maewongense]|uniref:PH domain-containing protein n=1 Tax=Dactylosporangium maewongense TaxID=634393 RepID=A0ABP4PG27_9ACTN